jgi:hypothetical protein
MLKWFAVISKAPSHPDDLLITLWPWYTFCSFMAERIWPENYSHILGGLAMALNFIYVFEQGLKEIRAWSDRIKTGSFF